MSKRIWELGVYYWQFWKGDPDACWDFHASVKRMGLRFVPNAIKNGELYERFGDFVPHPDVNLFRIDANIECVDTKMIAPLEYLAVGWGATPDRAEADVIRRILAPGLYTPCPQCRATRSDIDFEIAHSKIRCRICDYKRDAQ